MKKKIFSFIFAFIFVFPIAMVLVGCNNNPPNDPPPPTISLTEILDAFENKQTPTNFTMTGNTSTTYDIEIYENNIVSDTSSVTESTEGISLEYDNNNYSYIVPGETETYVVDGKTYSMLKQSINNQKAFSVKNQTSTNQYADMFTSKDVLNTIVSVSNFFSKNSVTADKENDNIVLTANFSIKHILASLVDTLKNNLDSKLHIPITGIINGIFTSNINFLDCVNEFKNSFTNTTTINDFIIFLSDKVGKDVTQAFELFYNLSFSAVYNAAVSIKNNSLINQNEFVSLFFVNNSTQEITFADFKTTKFSDMVEAPAGKTVKDVVFEGILGYIDNQDVTLRTLLTAGDQDEGNENSTVQELINLLNTVEVTDGNVVLDITMDKDYNITAVDANVCFGFKDFDNTTKAGKKIVYNLNYNFVFKDYQTTTVEFPQNYIVKYFDFTLDILDTEILALEQDYTKVLQDFPVESFEYQVEFYNEETFEYDAPVTLATFDEQTKTLTLNKETLQKIYNQEINLITISCEMYKLSINLIAQN